MTLPETFAYSYFCYGFCKENLFNKLLYCVKKQLQRQAHKAN